MFLEDKKHNIGYYKGKGTGLYNLCKLKRFPGKSHMELNMLKNNFFWKSARNSYDYKQMEMTRKFQAGNLNNNNYWNRNRKEESLHILCKT